jgi:hypothetical protein
MYVSYSVAFIRSYNQTHSPRQAPQEEALAGCNRCGFRIDSIPYDFGFYTREGVNACICGAQLRLPGRPLGSCHEYGTSYSGDCRLPGIAHLTSSRARPI